MIAALLFPALILATGFAAPLGWIPAENLYALFQHPAARAVLFAAVSLPMFHAAHRVRHTVGDLNLRQYDRALAVICYGAAVLGTLAAAVVLFWW